MADTGKGKLAGKETYTGNLNLSEEVFISLKGCHPVILPIFAP